MTGDFAAGARAVIERILQSPQFLYRIELGEAVDGNATLMRPTPHEMASRLSYLFWGSAPDQQLLDDAAAGKLRTKGEILAQAQRLVADPRAKDVARFFHGQLFGIRGLDTLVRDVEFLSDVQARHGLAHAPGDRAVHRPRRLERDGNLQRAHDGAVHVREQHARELLRHVAVTGDAFAQVNVDASKRLGLLTQASILAITTPGSRTDPVVRGKWVYTNMLCRSVPDPPAGIPPVADPTPGVTTRQRFEQHRSSAAVPGLPRRCSIRSASASRTTTASGSGATPTTGSPSTPAATFPTPTSPADFNGALELARKLGQSRDAQNCYVGKWLTYAYGRIETTQDACTRVSLQDAFATAGGNIKQLMVALTQTDAFLYGPAPTSQP